MLLVTHYNFNLFINKRCFSFFLLLAGWRKLYRTVEPRYQLPDINLEDFASDLETQIQIYGIHTCYHLICSPSSELGPKIWPLDLPQCPYLRPYLTATCPCNLLTSMDATEDNLQLLLSGSDEYCHHHRVVRIRGLACRLVVYAITQVGGATVAAATGATGHNCE